MFKSHRNHLAAIVILAVSNSTAIGQTINLVCNGTVHQSQPTFAEQTKELGQTVTKGTMGERRDS